MLKKFELKNCKEVATPIVTGCYLDADEKEASVEQTKYREFIGSLLYLSASRLDIMFSAYLYARYQANPKESYYTATKRILKYLKGTVEVGPLYPSEVSLNLVGYSDSDFAGYKLDRKSTSRTCHLLRSSLISWHSKNQACVALSTIDAKYIAVGSYCAQSLWIKQQLSDFV